MISREHGERDKGELPTHGAATMSLEFIDDDTDTLTATRGLDGIVLQYMAMLEVCGFRCVSGCCYQNTEAWPIVDEVSVGKNRVRFREVLFNQRHNLQKEHRLFPVW